MKHPLKYSAEIRGGLEAALQGASTNVTPVLLFAAVLGSLGLAPALWGVIATLAVAPLVRLLLGGHSSILPGIRSASLATYVSLVAQLAMAASGVTANSPNMPLSAHQLAMGLAAGSALFLITSGLILMAGLLRLGHIFKMIPTPVTAGISNGTALLLAWLAIRQMQHGSMLAWVTAAAMLLSYFVWQKTQRRWAQLRPAPAIAIAIVSGIACAWWLEPAAAGSVIQPRLDMNMLEWLPWNLWSQIPRGSLGHLLMVGLPGAVTLALVMILETMTTTHAMEMRFGQRTDANRELIAVGGSNILACLAGGLPSSGGLIYSLANRSAGGQGRLSVLVCFGLTLTAMLLLTPQMMQMAPGLAAGLLALQATLMVQPGFPRRVWGMLFVRHERQHDLGLWITLAITVVGFVGNLVWACFLGVSLSCMLVLRRVSVNLTARWAYLDRYRSRRVRSPGESETLARLTHQVAILRLTGHLFFGNSARLIQLGDELHADAKAVIIDVSQVSDADPSGCDAIDFLLRNLVTRGVMVALSGLTHTQATDLRSRLQRASGVRLYPDLDRALEACEDLVLINATVHSVALLSKALAANTLLQDLDSSEVEAVLAAGEMRRVEQSCALFLKGTAADGVWLLESGHVSILVSDAPDAPRLATFGPGQFVGEMGFIDGKTRSATARADTQVTAFLLDNQAIAVLVQKAPETVLKITRNIARELSHRVRNTSSRLEQESAEPAHGWANSTLDLASRF